jgi:FtsZ-binding cell division protein ZapB
VKEMKTVQHLKMEIEERKKKERKKERKKEEKRKGERERLRI